MSTPDEEASISLPSIAFVAVIGFLLYRYFFSSSSTPQPQSSSSSATSRAGGPRYTATQVDQIAQMFPQLNRRDIMWDLHRNRGSVATTTERVLLGGRLEPAPPSFQPTLPPSTPTITTRSANIPAALAVSKISNEPDLITRYNLQERISVSEKAQGKEKVEPNHGWASSKDERAAMLKRRRDEMILAARRKMLEKDGVATAEL